MTSPRKAKPQAPPRLNRTALVARGWTATLIARFLPVPDVLAPNPVYRSAPPMPLYDSARVAAIEATDAWQIAHRAAAKRSRAAQRAVATKREQLLRALDRVRL